ncbi:hypothetical protein [Amycolatopsis thermoflava]|uniref:hypothetical protein n=1 Tax=Amycolatopsis thermoflava TaxID=84480 RepID=UPI000404431E|nr:hypothetical protein [Amycolatopsis thermoflava]
MDEQTPAVVEAITRIHLEPGDVLAVRCPADYDTASLARLHGMLAELVPNHEVIVVSGDVEFTAINR